MVGSPDWIRGLHRKHPAAVSAVDDWIRRRGVGNRLTAKALDEYGEDRFQAGWCVRVAASGMDALDFHVLVDAAFPYSAPRLAALCAPPAPGWPHLGGDGLLCILPDDAPVSSEHPVEVVEHLLDRACQLVRECQRGSNIEDFRDEFRSYWQLKTAPNAHPFISLLTPEGPSRTVKAWRGNGLRVIGEDAGALRGWLTIRGAASASALDARLCDAAVLWLPRPMVPAEYPDSAADVRALASDQQGQQVIDALAASADADLDVLIAVRTPNGVCYGGVTIPVPQRSSRARARATMQRGFRPGHVPGRVLVQRRMAKSVKVRKANVQRADHSWVHGRDGDDAQRRLRSCRVAVLGCGALGGAVANLLAQAGVGNLLLVDPADLDWPNLSRHMLGAPSVDGNKAEQVAKTLRVAYPHLGKIEASDRAVSPAAPDLLRDCSTCDLVVSTTGAWAAESFLSDAQRQTPGFPPIVFGWLEAHAVAAHAVVIPQGKACLRCGVSDTGVPHLTVAAWPDGGDTAQEPACGAVYTPFGATALAWAHALVAECAVDALVAPCEQPLHRVWLAPRRRLEAANGAWSPEWIRAVGDPGEGGMVVERPWPLACSFCRRRSNAGTCTWDVGVNRREVNSEAE